ncbi:MAG TPA: hypothetical protein VMZ52_07630 [Bryobacteraceae bacterium]|nr:hypothetical protein [Bryobacteraceae bacterium]
MFVRTLFALCTFAALAMAANPMDGTWKLNAGKSKYVGVPQPKDLTVTYTSQGEGWAYEGKGTSATGDPINMTFAYAKDEEDIKLTGYPYADTLVLKNGKSNVGTGTFKREGKPIGTVKRTISADGKTMTVEGRLTLADGKKARYTSVYDKQ